MSIQNYLNQIKSAVFGKDVRQSIHDAIKQCYDDASIDHDNANMEVKLARGSHDTLNERFTSVEENIKNNSEQLEHIEIQKATKVEVDIERKRIDNLTKLEEGSTTGDAELIDIRIGADGVAYDSAGDSVREQFKKVNEEVLENKKMVMNSSLTEEKEGTSLNFTNTRANAPLFIKGFKTVITNLFSKSNVEMLDGFWCNEDTGMLITGSGNYGFVFNVTGYVGETITVGEITPTPGNYKMIGVFTEMPKANSVPMVFDKFKESGEFKGRSYASVPIPEGAKYLFVWYGAFSESENIDYYLDTMMIEKSVNPSKFVPYDGFKITACGKNVFSANKDEYYVGDRPSGQQLIKDIVHSDNDIRFRGNGGSYAQCFYKIYNLLPNTYYTASADVTENTAGFNAYCYGGYTDANGTLLVGFVGCTVETMEYYHFVRFSNIQVELGDKRTEFEQYESNEIIVDNDEFPITKLYAYNGITNILSDVDMSILCPVNTTNYINKTKDVNYNTTATMRDYKGNLKSVNEDGSGNLKLFPINKNKIKGRSKYNGNIYCVPYNASKCKVIDPNGAIIFERELGRKAYNFEKHYNSKGQLRYTYGIEGGEPIQISTGGYFTQYYNIVDENFRFIKQDIKLKARGNVPEGHACENHFFEYIDDNHYILSAYVGTVIDNVPGLPGRYKACNCVIQEIKDDKIVFHWESVDHPEFYNYSCFHKDFSNYGENQEVYNDYCHSNALAIDPKDGNFIVSFRHTGIAKINRQTGVVMWMFGRGGRIDFEGMTNEHCGYLQHDIRICDDGSLTIFDNSGCSTDNSRICRYWIDEESMQLVKFKEYVTPRKRSMFMGSAILLDDETETFLVCYGGLGTSEGTPDTSVLFDEINFLTGETNFTLENDLCAYRVIKYPNECKS